MNPLPAILLFLLTCSSVLADFKGHHAPPNWKFHTDGTGSVDTAGAPDSIALIGSDSGICMLELHDVHTSLEITAACDGFVSFDWSWTTVDEASFDPGGYMFNGMFVRLTRDRPSGNQDGHVEIFNVLAGDTFGFAVLSRDDSCGPSAFTSIHNFVGPDCGSISIEIDIQPGSEINRINRKNKKGVIPVAVLGAPGFDVSTVNVYTLNFEGALPVHDLSDPLVFADHMHDVNGDGETDLVTHNRAQDTRITTASTEGCLTGATQDGVSLEGGCDAVSVIKGK